MYTKQTLWLWRYKNEMFITSNQCLSHQTSALVFHQRLFSIAWSSQRQPPSVRSSAWVAPPEGWIKINFDAAVSSSSSMASAVARTRDGSVLCSRSLSLLPSSLLVAEARACLLAVELAIDNGWKFCTFEGDAKMVVDACCSFDVCPWEIRLVVSEILNFASYFLAWDFSFVHREANVCSPYFSCLGL